MKLKNFYLPKELDADLRYVSTKVLGISEAKYLRDLLSKSLPRYYPQNIHSPYGKKIIKALLRQAKNKCQVCRKELSVREQRQMSPSYKNIDETERTVRNSHIHHKNKNSKDNRLSNLKLVCPKCHRAEHKKAGKDDQSQ
jgi:transposase-like protein